MKKYGRDNRPGLKPVTRIELSEKNEKKRIAAAVLMFVVGMAGIAYGLFSLLNTEAGWQEIEASSDQRNCSGDFTLVYDLSGYGGSAATVNRQLNQLYTQAAEDAYKLFNADAEEEGLYNLHYLNTHVNEAVTVEPALYEALSLIDAYGNRNIYLAPVYAEYDRIFICDNSAEAVQYDPAYNASLIPYIAEAAAFADDPEMIRLELLENQQVRLFVSEEYLAFAEENEITAFVDFSWMKNAFIADYIAQVFLDNGFTRGYLVSYDGFTRNLDDRGNSFAVNIFDRQGNTINIPARMTYESAMSIVYLRDYPLTEQDRWHYMGYDSGDITSIYLDSADGLNKCAIDSLVSYSAERGCAEILLGMIPTYIAEEFAPEGLAALAEDGVYSVWCEDSTLFCNDPAAQLEILLDSYSKK